MANGSIEIVTTFVVMLASFHALPMVGWAQEEKPYLFEISNFIPSEKGILTTNDAIVGEGFVSLTSGGEGTEFCTKLVCVGKVFYQPGAKVPKGKGISFHTKFTFAMTKSRDGQVTGDGFIFFLGQHPQLRVGLPNGMFGLFSGSEGSAEENAFFGIEFDTMKNVDLEDQDDNHLGVDINSAISVQVATANHVNVQLNDGKRIVAWIDYDSAQNRLEARISYDAPGVLKPTEPLLAYTYDLSSMEISELWTGFSSASNFGFEQRHLILEWEFNANFDSAVVHAPAHNETTNGTTTTTTTEPPSGRLAAYAIGGVVALGIVWCGIVRFTNFGKKQHARCMKLVPNKIQNLMCKLCKKKEEGEEDDTEKPRPAAVATTGGGDDDKEEDAASFAPPPTPWAKLPPPKPPQYDVEDEDEEEDQEDDDRPPRMFTPPPRSPLPPPMRNHPPSPPNKNHPPPPSGSPPPRNHPPSPAPGSPPMKMHPPPPMRSPARP